jgi:hypothetical protein
VVSSTGKSSSSIDSLDMFQKIPQKQVSLGFLYIETLKMFLKCPRNKFP